MFVQAIAVGHSVGVVRVDDRLFQNSDRRRPCAKPLWWPSSGKARPDRPRRREAGAGGESLEEGKARKMMLSLTHKSLPLSLSFPPSFIPTDRPTAAFSLCSQKISGS